MRFKQLWLIVLIAGNCFAVLAQKYEWKQAAANGYTYKYVSNDPMLTRFYTLKNGLTVILTRNTKEPRISTRIAVRAGSNTDPKEHTGLAHYLEHVLFKGTEKYGTLDWQKEKPLLDKIDNLYEQYNSTTDTSRRRAIYTEIDKTSGEAAKYAIANEYDHLMASIGSQRSNAHTWVEETVYEEDIPSNAIDKFLAIQSERFHDPVFRIFHTELEAVYEEKNRSLDNDASKMQEAGYKYLFPTHNYGQQTTIGTIQHLKNPSLKAIRNYYYKYYIPNNMAIILAGDFNPDDVVKKIDQQFAYMKFAPLDEYKGTKEQPVAGPVVKDIYGPSAETMQLLYRVGPSATRDAMMADLVSSILSNGKAGLYDLNLNKQLKLIGARAGVDQYKDYGVLEIAASPKQGQSLEEVKDLLMQQINLLKSGQFDESLIKAIVANSKLSLLQGLDNNTFRSENLMNAFIKNKGQKWDREVAELDEMNKVTKQEVVNFANAFFTDNDYVVLYKRKGEDKNIVKVEKPHITPVETNAGKESPFVKAVTEAPLPPLKPVWLDYAKDIEKSKVGNADVLLIQNKENSLFRLTYRLDMGNWNNKLLSVAAQYLQLVGTDKLSAEDISKQFYNLACTFSVVPQNEETIVTISGLQENFDKAVTLFEQLLHNCKTDDGVLTALKSRIEKTRANSKLNKAAISFALRSYATYGANNPFNYVLSSDEVKNLKAEDVTALLHSLMDYKHKITYYGPKPLADLTKDLSSLHKIPAVWKENASAVKFVRAKQTQNQVLFADYDAVQAEIYWVMNLENYDPKQEALVNVFNGYFGGGMGSVVFQTIRESKALAYSTYAAVLNPGKKDDAFSVVAYVGTQADKLNDAVAGMNELLNDLPQAEQNFANNRKALMKDIETDRITKDDIIFNYLAATKKGVDHDLRRDNYALYNSITLNDISAYHKNQLSKKPYTYCIVASEKKINLEDLKKYGDVKVLGLQELFGY